MGNKTAPQTGTNKKEASILQVEFTEDKAIMSKADFLKYFGAEANQTVQTTSAAPAGVSKEVSLELQVTDILSSFGIPRHIKGFGFLREAIILCVKERDYINSITKCLYPTIAEEFDTTPSRAERAMRHAIEVGSAKNLEEMEVYFGRMLDKYKPTNGEFIATIADTLRLRGKHVSD